MIGFLRFVGVMNAAAWFGAVVLFVLAVNPASGATELQTLLGQKHYAYFAGAIGQLLLKRFLLVNAVCAGVAALHLLGEWLYLGRHPRRYQTLFLALLLLSAVVELGWIAPRLAQLHTAAHATNLRPEQREAAARSFQLWSGTIQVIHFLLLPAVGVYLWRTATLTEPARFVGPSNFRS